MTPLDKALYRLKSTFDTSLYGLPISLSVGLDVTKTFGASVVSKALSIRYITLFSLLDVTTIMVIHLEPSSRAELCRTLSHTSVPDGSFGPFSIKKDFS